MLTWDDSESFVVAHPVLELVILNAQSHFRTLTFGDVDAVKGCQLPSGCVGHG